MFSRRFALLAGTLLLLSVTAVGDQNTPTVICNDNRTPGGTLTNGVLNVHLEARQAVWYPNDPPGAHESDRVFVVNTWVPVGGNAFNTLPTINGKSWPDTERLTLKVGEPLRWRWINTSDSD